MAKKEYTPTKGIADFIEKELGIARPGNNNEVLFYHHSKIGTKPVTYLALCEAFSKLKPSKKQTSGTK